MDSVGRRAGKAAAFLNKSCSCEEQERPSPGTHLLFPEAHKIKQNHLEIYPNRDLLVSRYRLISADNACSDIIVFTNQSQYLNQLNLLGYRSMHEGFEDGDAWGDVRSTIPGGFMALPAVTNLGITWPSNDVYGEVTTGNGAARSGNWGFYACRHGVQVNGIHDGFSGNSTSTIYGVGGWIRSNTPPAGISLFLDPVNIDFNGNDVPATGPAFFWCH